MEYNDNLEPWKKEIDIVKNLREAKTVVEYSLNWAEVACNLDEYKINLHEGLIKSIDIKTTIRKLKDLFPDYIIDITDQVKSSESIIISSYGKSIEKDIKYLLSILNNLGWFISAMFLSNKDYKFDLDTFIEYDQLKTLLCEAKYDIKLFPRERIMYHATLKQTWMKISKIGLAPKSRSKKTYHPERVYLTKTIEDAELIAKLLFNDLKVKETNKHEDISNWVLLEADLSDLDYLEIYTDPNFKNGCYTVNNIPPNNLKVIKEINF